MRDLKEVARELAELSTGFLCQEKEEGRWLHGVAIGDYAAAIEERLTKRFALQPVAMEAVVKRLVDRITDDIEQQHVIEEVIAAELAPVATLLREWRDELVRKVAAVEQWDLSGFQSRDAAVQRQQETIRIHKDRISQIDTIIGGQHGTGE